MNPSQSLIAEAYTEYRDALVNYVFRRINDYEEASDLVQDVFLRLLSYDLVTRDTLKSLCYTVANNLVVDYLRRHYKRQEVMAYALRMEQAREVVTPEEETSCHNLAEMEHKLMQVLSPAAGRVYQLTRMEEMKTDDIASLLQVSKRTVECHQLNARKRMREMFRAII